MAIDKTIDISTKLNFKIPTINNKEFYNVIPPNTCDFVQTRFYSSTFRSSQVFILFIFLYFKERFKKL